MKTLVTVLIVSFLVSISVFSQEKPKLPSKEQLLKEIEVFAKSPLSTSGKDAAATIARFAQESEDVTVTLSQKAVPWFENDNTPKFSQTLLAAYIAGNVKSQLEHRTNASDSYAGVQQVLKTYAQLKEADKTLEIPEVQKLVDLEAKNKLKEYMEDSPKKDEKKSTK